MKKCHRKGCTNKLTKPLQKYCSSKCSSLIYNKTSRENVKRRETRLTMTAYYFEQFKNKTMEWPTFVSHIKNML